MEAIGEKIKRLRVAKGISQNAVAEICGIKQSSFANIENGKTQNITIDIGKGIAKALGISFNKLFGIDSSYSSEGAISDLLTEMKLVNNSLLADFEKLKSELEIQKKLSNAYEYNFENNKSTRKELKYYKHLFTLFESFELIDMEAFLKHNTCSITSEDLITTIKVKAINSFINTYGFDANSELTKYFDLEKFKKSDRFEFLKDFHEGSEFWTKERILQWVIEEKKKLLENNKSE